MSELADNLNNLDIEDTPQADDFDLTAIKKKKSKKSKKITLEDLEDKDGADADATAAANGEDDAAEDDFSNLKKKKKKSKSKTVSFDDEDEEANDDQGDADFDMSKMKKKKKSKKSLAAFEAELGGEFVDEKSAEADKSSEAWVGTDRDYTYPELLGRFYKVLRENNMDASGEKRKYTIDLPQVVRDGSKRTVFANVMDIAKRMHRLPDHFIRYLYSELGTTGSIDGSERLVIKGRFQQTQIANLIRRYIKDYVTCKTCRSGETTMTKEGSLTFVKCESCGSTRSVAAIKSGAQGGTKEKKR
ncbi:translation initiation factor eIF-2 beta subunit [Coemansia sp. RSA 1813]|nr:translation initiation factor eIF-2 beta subunit [Coemansia sp. RSA 1646]KAJ1773058.1 translation initiation factor eIF-2 beta subunit [Coemansia sp. RSA 1843]KAJ2092166.1 translation initiation factor eIF-2 beta subunit [Coemansia sp. RSA 986]KAJ2215302.1 translation initiation factor eIF-2 beta subunit [Coemansia sp. RSA 487]KAJ2570361.1 translation initiation factor eIF-2 beta subunit [Coemansia sp. RSA 1813]